MRYSGAMYWNTEAVDYRCRGTREPVTLVLYNVDGKADLENRHRQVISLQQLLHPRR
jgi:hypothetical protein